MTHVDITLQFRAVNDCEPFLVLNHGAFEGIHVADEFTHHPAHRCFVDIHRAADLGNPAQVHDRDALGHGHGLFLIVGHHDAGHADALDDFHQFELHLRAQFFIQRPHRLIEQQQLWTLGQRAGQGHTLTLAAGQLMRPALGVLGHVHQLEHLFNAGVDFAGRQAVLFEAEGNVLRHGHMREQGIGLEHHVDRPLVGRHVGDVHTIEVNTAFCWALETGEHTQQGGFARSRSAEHGEDFAFVDFQGHIVHGNRLVEFLRDPVDFDQHLFRCVVALEGFLIGAGGNSHLRNSQQI